MIPWTIQERVTTMKEGNKVEVVAIMVRGELKPLPGHKRLGTVSFVDASGNVTVKMDTGREIVLTPGLDQYRLVRREW